MTSVGTHCALEGTRKKFFISCFFLGFDDNVFFEKIASPFSTDLTIHRTWNQLVCPCPLASRQILQRK